MTRGAVLTTLLGALALAAAAPAQAQEEPATRAEALRLEREEKSRNLEPPEPSRLERVLLSLENGRLFERLLNPAEGLYPKIGNLTPGSGMALGPAYRHRALFGDHVDFNGFAAANFDRYWMLEAQAVLPRLAGERVNVDVHARRYDFPNEDFFGLGPDSRREDFVVYGLRSTVVGASASVRPVRVVTLGGGVDFMTPRVSAGGEGRRITDVFSGTDVPGLTRAVDFVRYEGFAAYNYRQPAGNPRRGGRYGVTVQRFDDRADGRSSFTRVETDLQQYISLLRERRVLALHALVSLSDADAGGDVPFYLQRTLGGPDDLRGFRRFRFRDRHMLLLQAEYRWEIFTAMDGAIFYDAGKVGSRVEDISFKDLESDYGIGFRFGTDSGVFLRVEGAFGSSGGKHMVIRFGHVF